MMLRDITRQDLELLRKHRNDPETRVFLKNAKIVSPRDQDRWFASLSAKPRKKMYQIAQDGRTDIGVVRVTNFMPGLNNNDGSAHVGCEVFSDHRRKGWGHILFQMAIDLAVHMGASTFYTTLFENNRAGIHIAEKAHFRYDTQATVEWYMRKLPGMVDPGPCAYIQMVKP